MPRRCSITSAAPCRSRRPARCRPTKSTPYAPTSSAKLRSSTRPPCSTRKPCHAWKCPTATALFRIRVRKFSNEPAWQSAAQLADARVNEAIEGQFCCTPYVRLWQIVLQKSPSRLCEIEICNNRIGASVLLNRCCSFVSDLESMFRDQMPKILLQHNRHQADMATQIPTVRFPRHIT